MHVPRRGAATWANMPGPIGLGELRPRPFAGCLGTGSPPGAVVDHPLGGRLAGTRARNGTGKRLVVLAQCLGDIPTDLRGLVRPILYPAEGLGVATLMEQLKDQLQIVRAETVTENMLVPLKEI